MLGARDAGQYAEIQEALVFLASPASNDVGAVLEWLLRLGGVNLKTMQMLSEAHASRWGRRGARADVPLHARVRDSTMHEHATSPAACPNAWEDVKPCTAVLLPVLMPRSTTSLPTHSSPHKHTLTRTLAFARAPLSRPRPRFGVPEPTQVPLSVRPGPCILISGHDMADMEALLQATEGKGVNGEEAAPAGARATRGCPRACLRSLVGS